MPMAIRLIAIDLDGTLLNDQREISAANRQALAAAANRGVEVIIVTGRRLHSARPLVAQLGFPVPLISSNGAVISTSSGVVVYRDFLPRTVAQQVLKTVRPYRPYTGLIFDVPGRGQIRLEESAASDGPLAWYTQNSPQCLEIVPDLEAALNPDLIQILFGGPPARIEPIEAVLKESSVSASIHLTWTKYLTRNISILDVMNQGCSKGRALQFWAERHSIPASKIMAIGDNHNDLEMLQYAGLPIVMANGSPELAREGWGTTLSNNEDGVAVAVHAHVLRSP